MVTDVVPLGSHESEKTVDGVLPERHRALSQVIISCKFSFRTSHEMESLTEHGARRLC